MYEKIVVSAAVHRCAWTVLWGGRLQFLAHQYRAVRGGPPPSWIIPKYRRTWCVSSSIATTRGMAWRSRVTIRCTCKVLKKVSIFSLILLDHETDRITYKIWHNLFIGGSILFISSILRSSLYFATIQKSILSKTFFYCLRNTENWTNGIFVVLKNLSQKYIHLNRKCYCSTEETLKVTNCKTEKFFFNPYLHLYHYQ